MIKERQILIRRITMLLDALVLAVTFFISYYIRNNLHLFYKLDVVPNSQILSRFVSFQQHFYIFFALIPLWILMLALCGVYQSFRIRSFFNIFLSILKAAFFTVLAFSSFAFIFKFEFISRSFFVIFILASIITLTIEKWALVSFTRRVRRRGFNYRRLLLVGTGPRAERFISMLNSHPEWGLKIVGLIDDDLTRAGEKFFGIKVIGLINDIPAILKRRAIDEVIFIVPRTWLPKVQESIAVCEVLGIKTSVAADLFDLRIAQASQVDLDGFPLLSFETTFAFQWQLFLKRAFDILVSAVLIILLLPVLVLTAILIKLTSKGPVLFRQRRMGLNGRIFTLYKFRSMYEDASRKLEEVKHLNEMDGPVFKIKNDPRITPLGRFLRKTSIDELPQLFNVFLGYMSIVGPRPPIPAEVRNYQPWQRRRLSMRPGITCLWQVSGRSKISFDKWMELDLQYIDNWSFWLDFKILMRTIPVVLFRVGAH